MTTSAAPSHFEGLESRQLLAVDLTASLFFTGGAALAAGTSYEAQIEVSNSGEALPQTPIRVHLFASPGTTYNPATSTLLSGATLSTWPRWGEVEQLNVPFTVPTTIASGAFSLFAFADSERVINESDETNNFSAGVPITITGGTGQGQTGPIDLTSSVTLSTVQIVPNTPVRATVSITNRGTGTVSISGTFVQLFMAKGTMPAPAIDTQLASCAPCPGWRRATDTGEVEFMLTPEQAVGTIRLYAVADLSNQTVETDETNNFSAIASGVGIGGVSDLGGSFISESLPASVVAGQKAPSSSAIKFIVRNAGDYPLTRGLSVVTRAYLRPLLDASGAGDIAVSDAKRVSVGAMAPQAQRTMEIKIKTPATLAAADYWLIVKIDDTNVLGEFSELNNTIDPSAMFSVVPATFDPGFAAGSSSFVSPAAPGRNGSVSLTLANLGNSLFKSAVSVQIFFRDAAGVEVGLTTFNKNVNVKAGGSTRLNSLKLKAPTAPGEYTLAARLVLPEGVADIGQGNNAWDFGPVVVAG